MSEHKVIALSALMTLVLWLAGSVMAQSPKIMVFSDDGEETYLGCLNCSEYETDSLLNEYGTFGNKYGSKSIFNDYGDFGSKYSGYSACSPYASNPPIIVDDNGDFYGHLSMNITKNQGIKRIPYEEWLELVVCEG